MNPNWACRLGSWLLWASLVAFLGVIGVLELVYFLPIPNPTGFREVVWTFLLRPGFALAVAVFLLGAGCHLVEGRLGGPGSPGR